MSGKLKILFILHLPPPVHGASLVGQFIQNSDVLKKEFDCDFLNLASSRQLKETGRIKTANLFAAVGIIRRLFKTLLKKRYSLCYVTVNAKGLGFYKDMLIVSVLKLFRYPIVYHYHNKGVSNSTNSWLTNQLHRYQFKNSYAILLSPALYYDISAFIPENRVFYCPNGIPSARDMNVEMLNKARISNPVPGILFLSNMMVEKGVYTLLEAVKLLHDRGLSFKSYLVGAEHDVKAADIEEYLKSNHLENQVFYEGVKYNGEKTSYFNEASLFVLPTFYHNEVFPLVILEAMSFGLPVISTQEGAISEMIEDGITGFKIPAKDARSLAEHIEILLLDRFRCAEMGINGRQVFESRYTVNIFENNLTEILKNITENRLTA